MALIRYPGSKERLSGRIHGHFPDEFHPRFGGISGKAWEYREPFFGAGAVGLKALAFAAYRTPVWLNDIDPGIAAIWIGVRDHPDEFMDRIRSYLPTPDEAAEDFYEFRRNDGNPDIPVVDRAFQKLVLHMTSFSGLGFMSGGPIGGKGGQSRARYKADCRWSPTSIIKDIRRHGARLRRFRDFKFTSLDFAGVIADAGPNCFIYADPPYVEKGARLYKHSMSEDDHGRLADALKETEAAWVLSYDDHDLVRDLYGGWTDIFVEPLKYTTANYSEGGERKNGDELIIVPTRTGRIMAGGIAC